MAQTKLKTVIATVEMIGPFKTGGVGTFVTNFAHWLRLNGHEVTIVLVNREVHVPREEWIHLYQPFGIEVIHAYEEDVIGWENQWWLNDSEAAARAIPEDVDIVYFHELRGIAFDYLRRRRFKKGHYPIAVTVMHGALAWVRQAMEDHHTYINQLELEFCERYATGLCDYMLSPGQYMVDWTSEHGWKLPPEVRVLGYPYLRDRLQVDPIEPANSFKRIIFFGRLEVRKGFELLIDALVKISQSTNQQALDTLEEIVFLGRNASHRFGTEVDAAQYLMSQINIPVRTITDYDTFLANQFLIDNRADSLVIIPSLTDNFPNTVLEASLIHGLNLIVADSGGIPEIIGRHNEEQFFQPYVNHLAEQLQKWLERGPQPADQFGTYEIEQRNQDWTDIQIELAIKALKAKEETAMQAEASMPSVDVVIATSNKPKPLQNALEGLSNQTAENFNVIVVDDASDIPVAKRAFQTVKEKYEANGWTFIQNQSSVGLSEARNLGADQGSADYILFLDVYSIPVPEMVAELSKAIVQSGDDCLSSYYTRYTGSEFPYKLSGQENGEYAGYQITIESKSRLMRPIGDCPELGMFRNSFGSPSFIIRRDVFEQIGKFSTTQDHYQYIGGEVHELFARLSFQKFKLDVYPEMLFFYRDWVDKSRIYQDEARVLEVYREQLREIGLEYLLPMAPGFFKD